MTYRTLPCSLRREHCLKGKDLAERLGLEEEDDDQIMTALAGETSTSINTPLSTEGSDGLWSAELVAGRGKAVQKIGDGKTVNDGSLSAGSKDVSRFEAIFTNHPPILESLLCQLPTKSILNLYYTNHYLQDFLRSYPLAWKSMSFRSPQPTTVLGTTESPDAAGRGYKQPALEGLLIEVIVPFGTRLTNLDLCNTSVSGTMLVSKVLEPRLSILQHLSVRGCKNVSIKYHLVPLLQPYSTKNTTWRWAERAPLALKSLYAYRCRHHRRRPYLPSSLVRRDSDSEPTHQLIEICHALGIWTDTAWCPTPGERCYRRKDYIKNRSTAGAPEVWVPFDRLWRSLNRVGHPLGHASNKSGSCRRVWEDGESGFEGEALGTAEGSSRGEGKDIPAHDRRSHKLFVDDIRCSHCSELIQERCEQCSVRMHCSGCRKTLCASCAFNRPLPKKRRKTRTFAQLAFGLSATPSASTQPPASPTLNTPSAALQQESPNNRFWWAPGAYRSPNLIQETSSDDDWSDSDDAAPAPHPLTQPTFATLAGLNPLELNMHWCCVQPTFSGGGQIQYVGAHIGGKGAENIRAAPLPRLPEYQDAAFMSVVRREELSNMKTNDQMQNLILGDIDIMPFLRQDSLNIQESTCLRSLCGDCYTTFKWRVSCKACRRPLCKEHDFRGLKVRKCGWRDLTVERDFIRFYKKDHMELEIPAFKRIVSTAVQPSQVASSSNTSLPNFETSHASSSTPQPPPHLTPINSQTSNDTASTPSGLQPNASSSDTADSTQDLPFSPSSNPSFVSRPRSSSLSDITKSPRSTSTTEPSSKLPPLSLRIPQPGHPRHPVQWADGCGSYFCQTPRAIGDDRARCNTGVRECPECGVYHCDACVPFPMCPCSWCISRPHCPSCFAKVSIRKQCRFESEKREREEREERDRRRREEEERGVRRADELAERLGEFFEGLWGGVTLASEGEVDEETEAGAQEGMGSATDPIEEIVNSIVAAAGMDGVIEVDPEVDAEFADTQAVSLSTALQSLPHHTSSTAASSTPLPLPPLPTTHTSDEADLEAQAVDLINSIEAALAEVDSLQEGEDEVGEQTEDQEEEHDDEADEDDQSSSTD